jgi:hypothetical protein
MNATMPLTGLSRNVTTLRRNARLNAAAARTRLKDWT